MPGHLVNEIALPLRQLPEAGPPIMIREMDGKALIFLHIPKTAGTTLNRIIEWQYSPLTIFTMDPYRIRATPERLQKTLGGAPPAIANGARTLVLRHP